jgi:hypothetical protein
MDTKLNSDFSKSERVLGSEILPLIEKRGYVPLQNKNGIDLLGPATDHCDPNGPSKIGFINYQESNRAVANWDFYGTDKFFAILRGANTKLRRSADIFSKVGTRFNYAFVDVIEEGQRVVKNLVDRKHMFSGSMPTAFYYDKPEKVKRFRSLLNLAQVGLGFLPIPGWIKGQVDGFIESLYVQQKLTEGALIGYFESNGQTNMVEVLRKQQVNPYILY